ncbi:hypothetical protein GF1_30050 [Desulfolithobacter dissulfuricans]|uniref:Uncharacterized protein n=1 Tax=Desulfolithobacter dissulfuricans TaxID=2795293 RepID=A0A915U3I3_9BACT|nr:hypothetical protein GF1_30050 [Desulfolithobacter dissulfuricans]
MRQGVQWQKVWHGRQEDRQCPSALGFFRAAQLFLKGNERGQHYLQKVTSKHGKGKALSILAHKLGRAVYFMLKNRQGFDMNRFLAA